MTSPLILVILLSTLVIGTLATAIAARQRAKFAPEMAIVFVSLTLLLWMIVGAVLPMSLTLLRWSTIQGEIGLELLVEAISWRSTLYLLIIVDVVLIFTRPHFKTASLEKNSSPSHWLVLPIIMLMVLSGLLAILANSLAGLVISWTILVINLFGFLWIAAEPNLQLRQALLNVGSLLLGVGFLWLAAAALNGSTPVISGIENWPEKAIIWTSLAGLVLLGAIPFQWWRSPGFQSGQSPATTIIFQLVPTIVGGSLLARMAVTNISNTAYLLFVTGFGLLGVLVGLSLAWVHLGTPRKSLSGLLLAEAGMVALVAVWASPTAAVSQVGVFALSLAALYLTGEKPAWKFNWPIIVPVAAITGMPITIGFLGLSGLYGSWLDRGLLPLLLVTVLLSVPLVAVSLLAWRSEAPVSIKTTHDRFQPILATVGMVILSLGLLTLPRYTTASTDILIWFFLLVSGVGGVALAWYAARGHLVWEDLSEAMRLNIPTQQIRELLQALASRIVLFIREAATILEGEGGMLWVLVLIIVLWLARRG